MQVRTFPGVFFGGEEERTLHAPTALWQCPASGRDRFVIFPFLSVGLGGQATIVVDCGYGCGYGHSRKLYGLTKADSHTSTLRGRLHHRRLIYACSNAVPSFLPPTTYPQDSHLELPI